MVTRKFLLNLLLFVGLTTVGLKLMDYTVIVAILAAALAVKHMAYILINGNIFQELRTYFLTSSEESVGRSRRKFFRKMYVLFSCNLCMTMQLAFWVIAIPTAVVIHFKYPSPLEWWSAVSLPNYLELPLTGLAVFLFSVVVAALAMTWWRILEYPQELIEATVAIRQQELALARAKFMKGGADQPLAGLVEADVMWVFGQLHAKCQSWSYCTMMLSMCFMEHLPVIIAELAETKGWNSRDEQIFLAKTAQLGLDHRYLQAMYREYSSPAKYEKLRKELAEQFLIS